MVTQLAEHLRDFDCEEASGVFDQVMKQCSSWVPGWMQVLSLGAFVTFSAVASHTCTRSRRIPSCGAQGQQAADTAVAGAERILANLPDNAVKVNEAQA